MNRRIVSLLVSLAVCAGTSVMAVPDATASSADVCAAVDTVTYSPPLSTTPQQVTVTHHYTFSDCADGAVGSGTARETDVVPPVPVVDCTTLPLNRPGSYSISWTGSGVQPSTFTFQSVAEPVDNNVVVTRLGQITAGTFSPDLAQTVMTYPQLDPIACATTGVASQVGLGTLTIGL